MARREHYVTFLSPGTFVSETSVKEIEKWDIKEAVKLSKKIVERHNARPYGFYFSTKLTAEPVPDGEGGFLEVSKKEVERSGMHFLGGDVLRYDDIPESENILRFNLSVNEYWICIQNCNSYKSTHFFEEDSVVVDDNGKITARGNDKENIKYRKLKNKEKKEKFNS